MNTETRRPVRHIEDTTHAREIVVIKLGTFSDRSMTGGALITGTHVEGLTYSAAPGPAALEYSAATRTEQVFVPSAIGSAASMFGKLVFCLEINRKLYALAKLV